MFHTKKTKTRAAFGPGTTLSSCKLSIRGAESKPWLLGSLIARRGATQAALSTMWPS
jgi:hypothetical protein